MIFNPNKTMVIVAHQDDEVIGCGGTIKKWANKGSEIIVVFVTDGSTGIDQGEKYKEGIVKTRKGESQLVSKFFPFSTKFLDYERQDVPNDTDLFCEP